MGQTVSSGVDMASSTSNVPKPNSISQIPDQQIPKEALQQSKKGGEADQSKKGEEANQTNSRDAEDGECGFCLFMKGGGCKNTFVEWNKCMEDTAKNKEDIVNKCSQLYLNLSKCMAEHSEYYGPILEAEKKIAAEAKKEI